MLENYNPASTQPAPPRGPSFLRSIGSLVLRAGVGAFVAFHITLPQLVEGWRFVWEKKPWALVDAIVSGGFPFPHILAPVVVLLAFLGGLALMLGFLSRVISGLMLTMTVIGFGVIAEQGYTEQALLCSVMFVSLIFLGSGVISMDAALSPKKPAPVKKRPLAAATPSPRHP